MNAYELKELLDRYERDTCTPEEKQIVEKWYSNIQLQENRLEQDLHLEDKLWANLNPNKNKKVSVSHFYRYAAAIALFVLGSGAAYFLFQINFFSRKNASDQTLFSAAIDAENYLMNNTRSPKRVTLKDGSIVTLQPGSSLRISNELKGVKREVFLTGEAFFNVKRDTLRPFYVYSKEVVTRVLGTSFNIIANDGDDEVTVAVKTGKVSVYTNDEIANKTKNQPEVILTPNQQIVYNREEDVVLKHLVVEPEIVLQKPTLFLMKYDGVSVSKILDVLEENYGVQIEYDREILKNCVLTTSMSDEGFYERIEVICKAINAEYTEKDAVIYISGSGCN